MWTKRVFKKQCKIDVAVCGSTLSALITVYSSIKQGLNVVWIDDSNEKIGLATPVGFDSLSPEGVYYLQHIISKEELAALSCGNFSGIHRESQYQQFDSMYGTGLQLEVPRLKTLLKGKIMEHISPIVDTVINMRPSSNGLILHTTLGEKIEASWLIDAQGKYSRTSSQQIEYLSDELFITRRLVKETAITNTASFLPHTNGWTWSAFDEAGNICITQWEINCSSTQGRLLFNSQWYRRRHAVESLDPGKPPRILLTVPTFFRLDPSCGLGATLQIKSALQAVRSMKLALSNYSFDPIIHYDYQMKALFGELARPLAEFYNGYNLLTRCAF
ncbi:MAG: hypothetical protein WBG90_03530 [Saonia sp.]